MTVSTTVPGGGLARPCRPSWNIRLLILFFTTTTANLGLGERRGGRRGEGERRIEEARVEEVEVAGEGRERVGRGRNGVRIKVRMNREKKRDREG